MGQNRLRADASTSSGQALGTLQPCDMRGADGLRDGAGLAAGDAAAIDFHHRQHQRPRRRDQRLARLEQILRGERTLLDGEAEFGGDLEDGYAGGAG